MGSDSNDLSRSWTQQDQEKLDESALNRIFYGTASSPLHYAEMTDDMCRVALSGHAGYSIDRADVEQDCSVLAKVAIKVIKAAYEAGKIAGRHEVAKITSDTG